MIRFRSVVLFAAFAMVVVACGSSDDTTTTTVAAATTTTAATQATTTTAATETTVELAALEVWADDKFGPIIVEIAVPFTEATGVPVEVTVIDFQDMREQIATQAPAGEGPDVFIGAHDWLGEMVENGIASPVDLGAKASSFTDVSKNALNWGGTQYAMPYAQEAIALYYNADLVDTAPATMVDLTATCDGLGDAITNCFGVQGGGVAPDAFHNFPFVSVFGGYIFGFSPETGFDVTDVGLDSEGAIAGVAAMEDLVAGGYMAAIDEDDMKQLFLDGEEAFLMSGPWWLNTWDEAGLNYGLTPLPTIEGSPMGPFVGVRGFYISEFGEQKAIAEEFVLNFIATDETMLALHEADKRGPTWIPTIEAIGDDPVFAAFAESATNGQFMPNVPEMGAVWDPLGNQLLAVRQGDLSAADAMAQAAEQVRTAVAGG
jgi:maltose-binding protein MalE